MNISKLIAKGSNESSPSPTHPYSSHLVTLKEAPASTRSAAESPSLCRTILDAHSMDILACASDRFLDLAVALRLETISARDLASLLAKSDRLGFKETATIEDYAVDTPVNEAHGVAQPLPRLKTILSTLGLDHGESSPWPQAYPVDVSREPKRLNTNEHEPLRVYGPIRTSVHRARPRPAPYEKKGGNNIKQRGGAVKVQRQRVKDAVPRPGNVGKSPRIQRGPTPSSDVKQSQGISNEVIVIADTEPESSGDDKQLGQRFTPLE